MAKQTIEKRAPEVAGASRQDPICGRRLESLPSSLSSEYKKRRYYFCSARCKDAFEKRTERFRVSELARNGALLTPGKIRWGLG